MREIAKLLAFPVALLIVGMSMAYNEQQTEENIKREKIEGMAKESTYLLGYTIKQDSPGLRTAHDVLPLDMPVAAEYVRAKKHRRSTKERK